MGDILSQRLAFQPLVQPSRPTQAGGEPHPADEPCRSAYDLLAKQTMAFKEGIEMLVANIVTFRNMMRGDFDALKTL
ncbi:hypothetical protein [Micromonospora coxensis]|uniref:hypothetical protein n=1 Tax=Micromonospora coxensis TaxID=356852 RepID=UPI0034221D87